ncbi:MAG: glycerate kinase [Pseudomonadota bacterium]
MTSTPSPIIKKMRHDAESIFYTALKAVDPAAAVKRALKREGNYLFIQDQRIDLSGLRHLYVIGAGKASAPMARAVEEVLGERVTDGVICTKYGHGVPLARIRLVEAGHPVPDENGRAGAAEILALASAATEKDLVLCLISGGGSALIPLPAPGLTLKDKQSATRALLACGATIHEINTLRKHLSGIKGGLLARAAHPATIITFLLSDVVGDDPDVIASGPTVADRSSFSDCMTILKKYDIIDRLPAAVTAHLMAGAEGKIPETPKPGDACFDKSQTRTIGSNTEALIAARGAAENLGYHTLILSSMIEGETREVARIHAAMAKEILKSGNPVPRPACLLSGGETTVTIRGNGKGGRNQEFALAAALEIPGLEHIVLLSAGTDGTDGPTDAAGAIADNDTLSRADALHLVARDHLLNNDAYPFFKHLNDLVLTGPTHTNVMDLRIILVV